MKNSEYIYSEICKIYDLYKENSKLEIKCFVETSKLKYIGTLDFDVNLVIPENSLILKDVVLYDDLGNQISKYESSIIAFDGILAFSYKNINSSHIN